MTIIAAIDRSDDAEHVVAEGARLAERFGSELHVVHVAGQYETTKRVRLDAAEGSRDPLEMDDDERARVHAESVGAAVTDDFTAVGLVGFPADEILRYADERDARYIVVGGRRRSPIGKALFGSTAQEILLESTRPVVTVARSKAADDSVSEE